MPSPSSPQASIILFSKAVSLLLIFPYINTPNACMSNSYSWTRTLSKQIPCLETKKSSMENKSKTFTGSHLSSKLRLEASWKATFSVIPNRIHSSPFSSPIRIRHVKTWGWGRGRAVSTNFRGKEFSPTLLIILMQSSGSSGLNNILLKQIPKLWKGFLVFPTLTIYCYLWLSPVFVQTLSESISTSFQYTLYKPTSLFSGR